MRLRPGHLEAFLLGRLWQRLGGGPTALSRWLWPRGALASRPWGIFGFTIPAVPSSGPTARGIRPCGALASRPWGVFGYTFPAVASSGPTAGGALWPCGALASRPPWGILCRPSQSSRGQQRSNRDRMCWATSSTLSTDREAGGLLCSLRALSTLALCLPVERVILVSGSTAAG